MDIYLYCHTYVKNIRCKDVPTKRLNVKLLQFISIVQDSLNRKSLDNVGKLKVSKVARKAQEKPWK